MFKKFFSPQAETIDYSSSVSDAVKKTTCYMCACRCGIDVHIKNDALRYITGNSDHPVNKGVICAKGSAGIMQQLSPAKLKKPMLRTGPRGSGQFKEIEWDTALKLATQWLSEVRNDDPKKLAFFTGRDQSQSLTGWWATKFGTPNYAAHGGFCSVNMAAAGLYTIGGSFWEFGEPDWDQTRYFMMFGVAEDHDSNPIKMGIGRLKTAGKAKFVSVNPVRTGYSAVADEWIGIRPGTDGLFIGALIHTLLSAGKVDFTYLQNFTNAPWLVIDAPGKADHGLFARDESGNPIKAPDNQLTGEVSLDDGRRARPAFELLLRRFTDAQYKPENVEAETGVSAEKIRRIAAEIAQAAFDHSFELDIPWVDFTGKKHSTMIARPVSFHAMRGISAHSNGFHTCKMLHILQIILGAIDTPGSMRYKAPFPKPIPPMPVPHASSSANQPLHGPPIGNPRGPEHLMLDEAGNPLRIDKAYSWENPLSIHGAMHMVLHNAWKQDPYKIDVLFMYMANMAWNSAMNIKDTLHYLTDTDPVTGDYKIKHFIYSDAFYSETVPYADLILPDTTYLERWDCISLLDRPISTPEGPCDSIRQPILKPSGDVRPFQDVLLDLGARLGLPGMVNEEMEPLYPKGYRDYLVNHERTPGIGPLAGWRGKAGTEHGVGAPNRDQLEKYIENGCFWHEELAENMLYYKHVNKAYLDYSHRMGWIGSTQPIILQIYDEVLQKFRLAAEGHGERHPPDELKSRVHTYCDPLPFWYPPFEHQLVDKIEYPLSAVGQRPAHMYHSWGSQNAWLRQITSRNYLYISRALGEKMGVHDEDWVWVKSHLGKIKAPVRLMDGVNEKTVWTWNAIGKRKGAWGLSDNAPESNKGFLLNHLISDLLPKGSADELRANADPVTGQAAWYDLRVSIEKCGENEAKRTEPVYDNLGEGRSKRMAVMSYSGGKK